jgi:drug/metabolite transporter (DMT)-like permease
LQIISLSLSQPLSYSGTLTVFFCGIIFLGEAIYFTDIIGSLFILGFNVYNTIKPIQEK